MTENMELFINRHAFAKTHSKYVTLESDNSDWYDENQKAIDGISGTDSGKWVEQFDANTKDVINTFLEYSGKVEAMSAVMLEAKAWLFKLFNRCSAMPGLLEGEMCKEEYSDYVYINPADDAMYDSTHHDTLFDDYDDISERTNDEESKLSDLSAIMGSLEYANSSIIDGDMSNMKEGIKEQRYLDNFMDSFQKYVSEVNDFNTIISSKFADIVGDVDAFPEFSRNTDFRQYTDRYYTYLVAARKGESQLFDDEGDYGGDQGGPLWKYLVDPVYFWRFYNFVISQPGFENYNPFQVLAYLDEINSHGCGYVQAVNVIFAAYEGREEEFEAKYGIPYYDSNGDLNYDKLLFIYYSETSGKVFTDSECAYLAYYADVVNIYKDDPDGFRAKYNTDLYDEDGNVTDAAKYAINTEYNALVGNRDMVLETGIEATTYYSQKNKLDHFLNEHGDSMTYEYVDTTSPMTQEEFYEYTEKGGMVAVNAFDYKLYDENGNDVTWDPLNIGGDSGHAMVITGVTDDGRYIVSSWGDEYYLDPDDCGEYYITVYYVEVGE